MTYRFGLLETYFIVLSILLIAVALLAWNRRPRAIARSTSFTLTTLALLTAGYALVLAAVGLEAKIAWYRLQVVGICFIPVSWMLISLAYAGHMRLLTTRNIALISIIPIVGVILGWTNEWHHFFLAPWVETPYPGGTAMVADPRVGYLVVSLYTLGLTPVGVILLAREWWRARSARRRLLAALLLAGIAPYLAEVIFVIGFNPIYPLDTTMFAFTVTGVAFAFVFFRRQSLELVPFALGAAVDELSDGLIVADTEGRVMYLNESAAEILGCNPRDVLELVADEIIEYGFRDQAVEGRHYDVRRSGLTDKRGRERGKLILIRDISELKRAELALVTANEDLEVRIAERTASLTDANRRLEEAVRVREQAERRARRLAREAVSTQEDERRRIARDLHDEAGQLLNALKLWLSLLADDDAHGASAASGQLDQIKRLSDSAIDSIRRVVWELRPPTLDSAGVNATLGWLCSEYERQARLNIGYRGVELPGCPEAFGITLYRCLQESLNNVVKHAGAETVTVTLTTPPGAIRLLVEDDGKGIPADYQENYQNGPGGMGIHGMSERAQALNGQLIIDARNDGGTRVMVTLPAVSEEWPRADSEPTTESESQR